MPTLVRLDTDLVGGGPAYGCPHMAIWWTLFRQVAADHGYTGLGIIQAYGDSPSSGGTHLQGTALDLDIASAGVALLARECGAIAWPRGAAFGQPYWDDHTHLVIDCDHNTPSAARYQIDACHAGYDGLGAGGMAGSDYIAAPSVWRTADEGIAYMGGAVGVPTVTNWPGERIRLVDGDGTDWIGPAMARDGDHMTVAAGAAFMGQAWDTLLWSPGTEAVVSWVIRARGTGTLTVTDAVTDDWIYDIPTAPAGTVTVAGAEWVEYLVPAGPGMLEGILAGQVAAIGVVVDSGAVDIDQICLQAWPPGGPTGGYAVALVDPVTVTPGQGRLQVTKAASASPRSTLAGAWREAMTAADEAAAVFPAGQRTDLYPGASVTASWEGEGGYATSLSDYQANWTMSLGAIAVHASPPATAPAPPGVQGMDWVRRPDRTSADLDATSTPVTGPDFAWSPVTFRVTAHADRSGDYTVPDGAGFYVQIGPELPIPTAGIPPVATEDVTIPDAAAGVMFVDTAEGIPADSTHTPTGSAWSFIVRPSWDAGDGPVDPFGTLSGIGIDSTINGDDSVTVQLLLGAVAATYPDGVTYWRPHYGRPDPGTTPPTRYLRQFPRTDGLGSSVRRVLARSSRQDHLRQGGYR